MPGRFESGTVPGSFAGRFNGFYQVLPVLEMPKSLTHAPGSVSRILQLSVVCAERTCYASLMVSWISRNVRLDFGHSLRMLSSGECILCPEWGFKLTLIQQESPRNSRNY